MPRSMLRFTDLTSKHRSVLREQQPQQQHPEPKTLTDDSSASSSGESTDSVISGCAEAALSTFFSTATRSRSSKSLDGKRLTSKASKMKLRQQKKATKEIKHYNTANVSPMTTPSTSTLTEDTDTLDADTAKAERISQLDKAARSEYATLREEFPRLPADPDLRAGILLLVTDCTGEVKLGKCDGEPGCEARSRIGSLKRRKDD